MSEAEKQEGQKTVVAFITGLLIGGLLVWVFSSSPEQATVDTDSEVTTTEETTDTEEVGTVSTTVESTPTTQVTETIGNGSLTVRDQKAGNTVTLGALTVPTQNGWVVVREYMDGVPGNVLGASRYSVAEGLTPTSVSLLRATEKGSSYQVSFYTESGDKEFKMKDDTQIVAGAVTFKAE